MEFVKTQIPKNVKPTVVERKSTKSTQIQIKSLRSNETKQNLFPSVLDGFVGRTWNKVRIQESSKIQGSCISLTELLAPVRQEVASDRVYFAKYKERPEFVGVDEALLVSLEMSSFVDRFPTVDTRRVLQSDMDDTRWFAAGLELVDREQDFSVQIVQSGEHVEAHITCRGVCYGAPLMQVDPDLPIRSQILYDRKTNHLTCICSQKEHKASVRLTHPGLVPGRPYLVNQQKQVFNTNWKVLYVPKDDNDTFPWKNSAELLPEQCKPMEQEYLRELVSLHIGLSAINRLDMLSLSNDEPCGLMESVSPARLPETFVRTCAQKIPTVSFRAHLLVSTLHVEHVEIMYEE